MYIMTNSIASDHLSHHGILNMHWGDRRYQNKDGTLTEAGKKRYSKQRGSYIAKMVVKKKQQEQVKAEKQVAKNEKMKAKIVKKRSAKEVYKHADLFSDDELKSLTNRLRLEKDLKDISPSLVDKGKKAVAGIGVLGDGLSKISYAVDSGTKAWNNTAKVMNTFYGTNMKIIGETQKSPTTKSEYIRDKNGNVTKSKVTRIDAHGNEHTDIRDYREPKDSKKSDKKQGNNSQQSGNNAKKTSKKNNRNSQQLTTSERMNRYRYDSQNPVNASRLMQYGYDPRYQTYSSSPQTRNYRIIRN